MVESFICEICGTQIEYESDYNEDDPEMIAPDGTFPICQDCYDKVYNQNKLCENIIPNPVSISKPMYYKGLPVTVRFTRRMK